MDVTLFQNQHHTFWRELESLAGRKRQRFRNPDELRRFVQLYQRAANDLAFAQTYFRDAPVTSYLNGLVAMAHNQLYRESEPGFSRIGHFFAFGFPNLFRTCGMYISFATLISAIGALYGYIMVLRTPLQAYRLLPPTLIQGLDPLHTGPHAVDSPLISSIIMTHNIQVALMAFVGGVSFGLYTVYSLWTNGIMLGILAAIFQSYGKSAVFWSLIVPHGVTELLAIFIAGGAGLVIAHRLIIPGPYRRSTAIRMAAEHAVMLLLGTVPMFVIAGTIEGFLTPSAVSIIVKFSVAIVSALFWICYFSLRKRNRRSRA